MCYYPLLAVALINGNIKFAQFFQQDVVFGRGIGHNLDLAPDIQHLFISGADDVRTGFQLPDDIVVIRDVLFIF